MGHIRALENHRFRRKLVQTRRMHFDAAIASECIRALLVGQKENQIRLSLCTHDFFDHELNQGWPFTAMVHL